MTRTVYRGTHTASQGVDRLESFLLDWSRWMRSGETVAGLPRASIGMSSGGASEHFDDMIDRVDRHIASVTNTVIEDLPAAQQCALHHAYLHAVFRFRDYETTLTLAKGAVRLGLKLRHIE